MVYLLNPIVCNQDTNLNGLTGHNFSLLLSFHKVIYANGWSYPREFS